MKVSVVTTVLNEEGSIVALLDSLLKQTKKPNEIVIVDGGSKDRTVEIIREYQRKTRRIKLVKEKGSIAHGRNVAVKRARHQIVAQIDGGCVAEQHWLSRITKPFEDEEVGVVAGFYQMTGDTCFQEAVAPFHGVPARRYDPRVFLPSGRSVAFRKAAWMRVGGYSECLERAGEDTLFNYRILRAGIKMVRVRNAVVYWELPRNFRESLKKLYHYAKGDGQAAIWWHPAQRLSTHSIKIASVFGRYLFASILLAAGFSETIFIYLLLVMAVFYMSWAVHKTEDVVFSFKARLWVIAIQLSSDMMVMVGFATGLLTRTKRPKYVAAESGAKSI